MQETIPDAGLEFGGARLGTAVKVGEILDDASKALLFQFESLGQNCEFGLVQRRYGAEPLGLFRWANVAPETLIKLLDSRFAGVGDADQTELRVFPWGELYIFDTKYDFGMHTFVHNKGVDREAFFASHCRRMRFLSQKLIDDLQNGEKILVYHAGHLVSDSVARRIGSQIGKFGPNRILTVSLANSQNPARSIRYEENGLVRAYVDRFGSVVTEAGRKWDIMFESWLEICRTVVERDLPKVC